MSSHPADPPTPVPTWLWPQRLALGEYDLRLVATTRELAAVLGVLLELRLELANVMLTQRDGSPWLEIDAVRAPEQALTLGESAHVALDDHHVVSLALWRYTCAVYRVGRDGAVEDEPIYRPPHPTDGSSSARSRPRTPPPTGGSVAPDGGEC